MKRKHLSGKSIGIVFGTFAPMHVGHVDLITKEKRANDNVLVIVSSSNTQKDRGTRTGLSLNHAFVMSVKFSTMMNSSLWIN